MNLRKVCQHPYLFGEPRDKSGEYVGVANPETLVAASGKLALLDRLLKKLKQQGHKVTAIAYHGLMVHLAEHAFPVASLDSVLLSWYLFKNPACDAKWHKVEPLILRACNTSETQVRGFYGPFRP